jgi:hypothetical protein
MSKSQSCANVSLCTSLLATPHLQCFCVLLDAVSNLSLFHLQCMVSEGMSKAPWLVVGRVGRQGVVFCFSLDCG